MIVVRTVERSVANAVEQSLNARLKKNIRKLKTENAKLKLNLFFVFLRHDNRTNKGSERPYSGFEEISLM